MRITGLLILLLFLVIFFAAPAASYAQNSSTTAVKSVANAETSMAFDRAWREFARRDGLQIERDGVCYTMRTYVMAREEKNSDVTYPVRVTRCLPSSKLDFKSAVQPVEGADSEKLQR
jgi:hypothetical protein